MIDMPPVRRMDLGYFGDGYRLNLRAKWKRHKRFVLFTLLLILFTVFLYLTEGV